MSTMPSETGVGLFKITTPRLVTAAVLFAITIIMGAIPGIGIIPVPNVTGGATILHIPTILGSTLEGPLVGIVTGISFGIASLISPLVPIKDPLIVVFPRLLVGITPWLVFIALRRVQVDVAAGAAGLFGSLTNTIAVVGMAVVRNFIPASSLSFIIPAILPQVIAEAILATLLNIILVRAVLITRNRVQRAPAPADRSKLPY